MTNRNSTVFALALLALALTETQTGAQSFFTPYAFTNFAGMPGGPGNVDGLGSAARFSGPNGIAVDGAANVYVADSYNGTIRKITPAGAVTTLAGIAGQSGSADGTGSAARFSRPNSVAVDSTANVYVADSYNGTIRKITPAGVATTLAGTAGQSGSADGTGSDAQFFHPSGVAVDGVGNVYVADESNYTIRKITPAGAVTTLAGGAGQPGSADGTGSEARFGSGGVDSGPSGVAVDSTGNVYVADTGNSTIRKITPAGAVTTLAGSAGQWGSADGPSSAARFSDPNGLAVDSAGNIYVADRSNSTIRKVTPAGFVTTLAGAQPGSDDGTGPAAAFYNPSGAAVDSAGNVYVADGGFYGNNTIRKITPSGVVTTFAGSAEHFGSADGIGSAARFGAHTFVTGPSGVAVDTRDNVYVADSLNRTIRKVTPAGMVTTLAGRAGHIGSTDGTGTEARFTWPSGVVVDSTGTVYVLDSGNTVRKITADGAVTTLAGSAGKNGSTDGGGSEARFGAEGDYFGSAGVAVDSAGNVYVADRNNSTVRKITPAGAVTTLAGSAGQTGSADGTGSAARFWFPQGVTVDTTGNVYVADSGNNTIRKITPAGVVTTLAGLAQDTDGDGYNEGGYADGTGSTARFFCPNGVAVDSAGNVYVADSCNATIRKITSSGVVTTLAGRSGQIGGADGIGRAAQFSYPMGIAVDSAGKLYLSDSSRITKGTPFYFQFDTSVGSLAVSDGLFQMRLTGPSGSDVIVESSASLQVWTPVQTNALPSVGLDLSIRLGADQAQFFRARLAP